MIRSVARWWRWRRDMRAIRSWTPYEAGPVMYPANPHTWLRVREAPYDWQRNGDL